MNFSWLTTQPHPQSFPIESKTCLRYNAPIMIKLFRDKRIQKKIYIGLASIVTLSFVVSGMLIGKDDKRSSTALAKFENRKIHVQEYLDSYRAVQKQAELMYGDKLNQVRSMINFKSEAWDRILLLEYAKKEHIHASDQEVVDWITQQPGFQKNGRFSDEFYKMYVEKMLRSTPRQFEEEIRQMLTVGKVYEKVKGNTGITDEHLKEAYKNEKSEKSIVYGILSADGFEDKTQVEDKDIEQLYQIAKDRLTSPEKTKLRYYFIPKESQEASKTALEDTQTGFDDLAQKYSLTPKETDFFSKKDSVADLTDAPQVMLFGFEKAAGESSGWIQTEKGTYKAKVLEKQAEKPLTLEEAKNELTRVMRHQKAAELAIAKMKEIKAKIKAPEDFEKVLKDENIEILTQNAYKPGTFVNGLWPSQGLEKSLNPLGENQISDAFEVPKGAAIVKVSKINGFDEKKYETDKTAFKEEQTSKKSQEEINKILENMRNKLQMNLEVMKEIFPTDSPTS